MLIAIVDDCLEAAFKQTCIEQWAHEGHELVQICSAPTAGRAYAIKRWTEDNVKQVNMVYVVKNYNYVGHVVRHLGAQAVVSDRVLQIRVPTFTWADSLPTEMPPVRALHVNLDVLVW